MRVSVLPSDRLVVVDGVSRVCNFTPPADVHAIQWDGTTGFLEWKPGARKEARDGVTLFDLQSYITAWEAAYVPPAPPPVLNPAPVVYSKRALFRVMTDSQFATFDQTRGLQSARKKAIFDAANELPENGPDFAEFRGLMVSKFGEAETVRLLEASLVA